MSPPSFAGEASAAGVERKVAADMIRRTLPAMPAVIALAGLIWGVDGALSAGFAIGLVMMNFLLSAALLSWSARISLAVMMVVAMGGFIVRLALITAIVLLVKDQAWVELVPLGLTLIITHLGLLIWETRHVSTSLAFPGLKPQGPARPASGVSAS
jgi:hypothetical protein